MRWRTSGKIDIVDLLQKWEEFLARSFFHMRNDNDGLIAESKGHFDSAEYERQLKQGVDG